MIGQDFDVKVWSKDFDVKVWSKDFEFWNLIKICVRTCFFGKQNSTLGSVVPLAMFLKLGPVLELLLCQKRGHFLQKNILFICPENVGKYLCYFSGKRFCVLSESAR